MTEWKTLELGEVCTLQRGMDLPKRLRTDGNFPLVTSSGVDGTHSVGPINGPGVITGRYGTIGKVFFIETNFWPLNTTLFVKDFHGNDPRFVHYLLKTVDFQSHSGKSGVPGVNRNDVHQDLVHIPPDRSEQEAIALTLFDADTLINSLEQLLTKKREIKQGTMQELLTGQRRLPGFSRAWNSIQLGNIGRTYGGLIGKSKVDFGHGGSKYITFMNVMTNVRTSLEAVESVQIAPSESQNMVQPGDLLFNGSSETPEEVALCSWVESCEEDIFLNSFCFGFRPFVNDRISGLFMAYFFRARPGRNAVSSLAQGATRYNIAKTALLQASLRLPDFEEQKAIAETLSCMDDEITALEFRLTKARDLKQAMAQALLTGRIRLVEPKA